jgi:autotransporter-associated beta strand protein
MMFVAIGSAHAALYWDADGNAANNTGGVGGGGTGNWNVTSTNKVWYDGVSADVAFTAGGDAVFAGAAGTVTVSGSPAPNKLTISTDGYSFTGNLGVTGTGDNIIINGNARFNGSLSPASTTNTVIDASKTLTLAGGGKLYRVTGGSISLTGLATTQFNMGVIVLNSNLTQDGSTATATVGGQNPGIGSGATGSWTMNTGSTLTISSTVNFDIGRYDSSLGTAGNGTLTINDGSATMTGGAMLRIGSSASNTRTGTGLVTVAGGSLSITGNNGSGTNSTLYIGDSGNGSGKLSISGGTVTADTIRFGRVSGSTVTGTLEMTSGSLNVGANGIALDKMAAGSATINLSGGTVGATADWSSSMGMNLLTTSGTGIATFRADDGAATPVAHDIALSGKLTGAGTLTKTGAGKLTLSGANDYIGATKVNAGTLVVNGSLATASAVTVSSGGAVGGTGTINGTLSVAGGGSVDLRDAAVGALSLKGTSVTLGDAASATLVFDLGTALGSNDSISITNSVALGAGGAKISLNTLGTSLAEGNYTLITAGGGLGTNALSLANTSLILNNVTYRFSLDKSTSTAEVLTVAIPEPASVATTLGLGATTLLLGRRRRQGSADLRALRP